VRLFVNNPSNTAGYLEFPAVVAPFFGGYTYDYAHLLPEIDPPPIPARDRQRTTEKQREALMQDPDAYMDYLERVGEKKRVKEQRRRTRLATDNQLAVSSLAISASREAKITD
jgi:hypothetical protein